MNRNNLQVIFKKYIENFEMINNKEHDENYKWEIIQKFQSFDVNAPDFAEMLARMRKISENLVDAAQQLPFTGLVECARKEPETVRQMFKDLYAEEHLDEVSKQAVIDAFVESSEELRKKYFPESRLYVNNQRSAMMLLFLRYPDSNYGYKAAQAKSFADCIEFYEDWGPMTNFRMDVYNRMCDGIVEEIKQNEALLATHMSRFENTERELYPDRNLHVLVLDIIFSSQVYDFYTGMTFNPINASARKLHFEQVDKAKTLAEKLAKAKADSELLEEAKAFLAQNIVKGLVVKHKLFGEGTVEERCGSVATVRFEKTGQTKKLGLTVAVRNGLISLPNEEMARKIDHYSAVLDKEAQIPRELKRAEDELNPYLEYLE